MPRQDPNPERRRPPRKPDRVNRPSVEELGGLSEYQVRSATDADIDVAEPDPERSIVEEPLSVDADELGSEFLRGAVQDARPAEPDEPRSDELEDRAPSLGEGEERMLDGRLGTIENEAGLITSLDRRSEQEGELSRLTHEVGKEVRIPDRAARIREQSRRVAELRADSAGEYLGRRTKPRRGSGAPR